MNDEPTNDERLNRLIKQALDRDSDALDAGTVSRLNQARQDALAQLDKPSRNWLPIGLVAGAATAVLLIALSLPQPIAEPEPVLAGTEVTDLDMLADNAELALLDDLEFYLWVSAQLDETVGDPLDDPLG